MRCSSLCFLRCCPSAASMFCALYSVVLTDVVISLSLYAPVVCMFPQCWISCVCHLLLSICLGVMLLNSVDV